MKYNLNINQKAIITHGYDLDVTEAILLDFIIAFVHSPKVERIHEGKITYYWISHDLIIAQLPILKLKNADSVYRRMSTLCRKGFLTANGNNKKLNKSFYAISEKSLMLQFQPTDENPMGYGEKSDGGRDENPMYNNTIDTFIKDEDVTEILQHYQKVKKENFVDLVMHSEKERKTISVLIKKHTKHKVIAAIDKAVNSPLMQEWAKVYFNNIFKEENILKLLRGEFDNRPNKKNDTESSLQRAERR